MNITEHSLQAGDPSTLPDRAGVAGCSYLDVMGSAVCCTSSSFPSTPL